MLRSNKTQLDSKFREDVDTNVQHPSQFVILSREENAIKAFIGSGTATNPARYPVEAGFAAETHCTLVHCT